MPDMKLEEPKESASQPIGSLAIRILRSALASTSINPSSKTNLPASPTTGRREPAPAASSETGPRRGETGSARLPTIEALVEMSQVDLDRTAMDLVPPRLASRLAWRLGNSFNGPRALHLIGEEAINRADLETALANLEPLRRPATPEMLARARTEMRTVTSLPRGVETELQIAVWIARLSWWPADIALWALREWPSRSKWWPSWNEIEGIMSRRAHERLELYARLRSRLALKQHG